MTLQAAAPIKLSDVKGEMGGNSTLAGYLRHPGGITPNTFYTQAISVATPLDLTDFLGKNGIKAQFAPHSVTINATGTNNGAAIWQPYANGSIVTQQASGTSVTYITYLPNGTYGTALNAATPTITSGSTPEWLLSYTGDSASNYEFYVSLASGTLTDGVLNSWQSLSVNSAWYRCLSSYSIDGPGVTKSAQLTVKIRRVSTTIDLSTVTVTLSARSGLG